MVKSRPATSAWGPQARGLPWRAEMQPNCPGYQERLCLSSWNRYSTRTGKARKSRTRRGSFFSSKKRTETFSHVRLQISALGRRFAISHGSNQLIQCWRRKFLRSHIYPWTLDQNFLDNNVFQYQKTYFKQIRGLARGNRLSGTLAIICMDKFERNHIYNELEPKIY